MQSVIKILLCFLLLVGTSGSLYAASNPASKKNHIGASLARLDSDSSLIVSAQISHIEALYQLAMKALPKKKMVFTLGTIAVSAVIGWNPFNTKAWDRRGFATDSRLLLGISTVPGANNSGAKNPFSHPFWRIRLILPTSNLALARKTIDRLNFRHATIPIVSSSWHVSISHAQSMKRHLQAIGGYLFVTPLLQNSLIVARPQGQNILIDLIIPSVSTPTESRPKHPQNLVKTLTNQSKKFVLTTDEVRTLSTNGIGIWLHAEHISKFLTIYRKSSKPCTKVQSWTTRSPFRSVSAQFQFSQHEMGSTKATVKWHFYSADNPWRDMPTRIPPAQLNDKSSIFQAHLSVEALREIQNRIPEIYQIDWSWNDLWRTTQTCGPEARYFALLVTWPQLLAALHTSIGNLGSNAEILANQLNQIGAMITGAQSMLIAEAWVRSPGDLIAMEWLSLLFGKKNKHLNMFRWGNGPIEPYSISRSNGAIIGAGFSPGSRAYAMASKSREPAPNTLFSLQMRPQELSKFRLLRKRRLPFQSLWNTWGQTTASLSMRNSGVVLDLRVE